MGCPSGDTFALLWRGSVNGFGAANFHAACDGVSQTVTIITAASTGYIFGGYTSAAWSSAVDYISADFTSDSSSFIFSLVNENSIAVMFPVT